MNTVMEIQGGGDSVLSAKRSSHAVNAVNTVNGGTGWWQPTL